MINQKSLNLSENGWPTCPKCGGILHWNADYMASEVGLVEEDEEKDDIVNYLCCPNCNSEYYYRQSDNTLVSCDSSKH